MGTRALDAESFDSTLKDNDLVFVDFWASWCGPCRQFAPVYEAVSLEHPQVVFAKVDTEASEDLAERFEIKSIPTLMAFRGGTQVLRQSGALSPDAFRALVENVKKLDAATARKLAAERAKTESGERPTGVAKDATWNPEEQEWAAGPLDADGKKHGVWRYWRADGTLCNECLLVRDVPEGDFKRFHENGAVSQQGRFERGQVHGTRTWFASDAFTTERMHEGGVSSKIRKTEMDYERGRVVAIRHFNAKGQRALPTTGEPYPDRPKGLPNDAEFNEVEGRWAQIALNAEGQRDGRSRLWAPDGAFRLDAEYVDGEKHGKYVAAADPGEFRDEKVAIERGTMAHDHRVGTWTLEKKFGEVIVRRDLGVYLDEPTMAASAVLSNQPRSAAAWRAESQRALNEKRPGEALLALARASGNDLDAAPLLAAITRHTLPHSEKWALGFAESLRETEEFTPLQNALLSGADPAAIFRALAIKLDQVSRPRAALDFINAALLIAPDRQGYFFTRGLVLMSLGLATEAAADAQRLAAVEPDTGAFLANYAKVLFPTFEFWPARDTPETTYDDLPSAPTQQLAAVREVFLKYAARLQLVRTRAQRYLKPGTELPWMVPELPAFSSRATSLDNKTIQIDGEAVEIDERLELTHADLPDLLRIARADWNALCWLCWACGMKEVALPREIQAPQNFGVAAGMSAQRLWRCRDRRVTGGEMARQHGVKSFSWEGFDIDALPPQLVSIAEQQYAEMQAMFYWLTGDSNQSPWQDNLRGS